MSDIGKGDWVECIATYAPDSPLKSGSVYYVEGIHAYYRPCPLCQSTTWIRIADLSEWYNSTCLFRPLKRPPDETVEESTSCPIKSESFV